jgi:hypothetical protein
VYTNDVFLLLFIKNVTIQKIHWKFCTSEKPICKSPTPTPKSTVPETNVNGAPAESNGDLGEDMLQMALRMASEMSEPVMDLENSIEPVPVNTGMGKLFHSGVQMNGYTHFSRTHILMQEQKALFKFTNCTSFKWND